MDMGRIISICATVAPCLFAGKGIGAEVPSWFAQPVEASWADVTASQAVIDLANQLGRPIWMSDAARQHAARTRIHFTGRGLNGYQALSALCCLADLHWIIAEDLAAITPLAATPMGWRLIGFAYRARIRKEHPEWERARVAKPTADLDLVDATPMAATDVLGEAFSTNIGILGHAQPNQKLVSLQRQGINVAGAVAELARQLDVRVLEAAGIFWLVFRESLKESEIGSNPARQPMRRPMSRAWKTLRSGSVEAAGWADEIAAIEKWRKHEGGVDESSNQSLSASQPR